LNRTGDIRAGSCRIGEEGGKFARAGGWREKQLSAIMASVLFAEDQRHVRF
jgi:hypothetical protein